VGGDGRERRAELHHGLDHRCLAMFAPLSIVVVYLGSLYPEEGGLYVWSKRAFGRSPGS